MLYALCRSHPGGDYGSFGFPIVTDPIEIHRFFENQMDQMLQRFGMFGTQGYHKTWEDENITGKHQTIYLNFCHLSILI